VQQDSNDWLTKLQEHCMECRANKSAKGILKLEEYMGIHHRILRGSLFSACLLGQQDVSKKLLATGVDINATDRVGATALHMASLGGNVEMVQQLLNSGAATSLAIRDTKYGLTALHVAVLCGHAALVPLLAGCGGVAREVPNNGGHTALYLAADMNQAEATHALLDSGCDPWRKETQRGFTPLHIAAFKGSVAAAKELLQHTIVASAAGLSYVQAVDASNGGSALHWAVIAGQYEMAAILLQAGAQPNGRDKQGSTPLHLVRPEQAKTWEARHRFLALLGEHGAQNGLLDNDLYRNVKGELPLQGFSEEAELHERAFTKYKSKRLGAVDSMPMVDEKSPNWVQEHDGCMVCTRGFSFMNRKHHCRRCGWLLCAHCSSMSVSVNSRTVRLCDGCFNTLGSLSFCPAVAAKNVAQPPQKTHVRSEAVAPPQNPEHERFELFGGGKTPAAKREVAPATAKEKVNNQIGGTKNLMSENLQMAHQRGNKAREIADQTSQMADDAKDFASSARRLRMATEKKGFLGLW